jgi:Cys-tRNA(Pro)/Cys-tRNA(Cys) deacylase
MSKSTKATLALEAAGVAFSLHTYVYDPDAPRMGLQAAEALGEDPGRVLKTLMAEVDGKAVCVVIPSDQEVSMKKLAAAFGGKSARMMKAPDAERLTGFVVGGISPFGQKKAVPSAMEDMALLEERVYMNGGRRGLQVRLDPAQALKAMNGIAADLIA